MKEEIQGTKSAHSFFFEAATSSFLTDFAKCQGSNWFFMLGLSFLVMAPTWICYRYTYGIE